MPDLSTIGGECMESPDGYHIIRNGICVYCGYDVSKDESND